MDDLCHFASHITVLCENDKPPWLSVAMVRRPSCGFDYLKQDFVVDKIVGEFSDVSAVSNGVEDQYRSP